MAHVRGTAVTSAGIDPTPATRGWLTDHYSPDGASEEPSLSADGRFVAFTSSAINFTSGDANERDDIIVYDLPDSGPPTVMQRASVSSAESAANEDSSSPSISSDGRYVAFRSAATNLVSGDTNEAEDIFLRDRTAGTTTRISVASGGAQADGRSYSPAVSAGGRYVAFSSDASNLVSGDTNGLEDVFVRDRVAGTTSRVSVSSGLLGGSPDGYSTSPSISADGRFVAFDSTASNLVSGDTNSATDVFVRDRTENTTSRVSVASSLAQGPLYSRKPSISADGNVVAFESLSSFHPDDTNSRSDIYVRDRVARTTAWISNGCCYEDNGKAHTPSVSASGRYVAYASDAPLAPTDTNGVRDIYEADLDLGRVGLISADQTIERIGNAPSDAPSVSDVRTVAFTSSSTNFSVCFPGHCTDNNRVDDVFIHEWVPAAVNDPTAALTSTGGSDCVGWSIPNNEQSSSVTATFLPGEECDIRPAVPRIPIVPEPDPDPDQDPVPIPLPPWGLPDWDEPEPEPAPGSDGYHPPPRNGPPQPPDRCERDDPPPQPQPPPTDEPETTAAVEAAEPTETHHVATVRNKKNPSENHNGSEGDPWTKRFKEEIFKPAGIGMHSKHNKLDIPADDHKGPHPQEYHREIFDRLIEAMRRVPEPKTKDKLHEAVAAELDAIKAEILTPGTDMQKWVKNPKPFCPRKPRP